MREQQGKLVYAGICKCVHVGQSRHVVLINGVHVTSIALCAAYTHQLKHVRSEA